MIFALLGNNSSRKLIFVFVFLAIMMALGSYVLFSSQKNRITNDKQNELASICQLKVQQIVSWRRERLENAESVTHNLSFINDVKDYTTGVNRKERFNNISSWLVNLKKIYHYPSILLLDKNKNIIIKTDAAEQIGPNGRELIRRVLEAKKPIMSDLHRNISNIIHIDLVIPLYDDFENKKDLCGILFYRIDPNQFLFPLIQTWPTPSLTSETVLIRRAGDSILILNELKNKKNTALNFYIPLTEKTNPSVNAVLGVTGNFEGKDYRKVKVLANLQKVPDSPWYIIAKVDKNELLQPLLRQAILIFLFTTFLIFMTGIIVYMLWKLHISNSEKEKLLYLKHLDYLVKYANDIIILGDIKGNIIEVNDKALTSYGYTREEMLIMNIKQLRAQENIEFFNQKFEEIVNEKGAVYEIYQSTKNGTEFPVEVSARTIDVDGEKFIQAIIRDITERRATEESLLAAKENAEESDRLKSAFLANMSHEIRTPMNGILGFSELLNDDTISQEERFSYINVISENSRHLMGIVNDIIDISKIDSNQLPINNVSFNLNQLMDDLFMTYENEKKLKMKDHLKIEMRKSLSDENSIIFSDDIRLRQILYNLLGNALKFTKTGVIKFEYAVVGDKLQFSVQDTGKGVAKENQAIIFERFRQEEDTYTRYFGGTGLGLSISKGLVELLGGNLWLESEPGIGSTFFFTIKYC